MADGSRLALGVIAAVCGCTTSRPAAAPVVRGDAPAADAGPAGPCAGAADDARRREADAERVETDAFDLDGDGLGDALYRGGCGGFAGNCAFLVYRCTANGATYLGAIEAFRVDAPWCVDPPAGGRPCRLSARRRMLHDDYQDALYDVVDGQYTQTGDGAYIPPRRRP